MFDPISPLTSTLPGVSAETICTTSACDSWTVRTGGAMPGDALTDDGVLRTLVHELAHVYDGMDDGMVNGSRLDHGIDWTNPITHYTSPAHCDTNPEERYACGVVQTGRIE